MQLLDFVNKVYSNHDSWPMILNEFMMPEGYKVANKQ